MKKKINLDRLPVYEINVDEENKNQGIRFISIVEDPAIEISGMYFSKDEDQKMEFKSVKDKQMVVGPAIIPGKKILRKNEDGEYYYVYFTVETIKKLVEKFTKDNPSNSINIDHSNRMVPGFIMSSWIVEDPMYDKSRFYGYNLPIGSYFIEVKIDDSKFWEEEIKGLGKYSFSIEGILGQKLVQLSLDKFDDVDYSTLEMIEFIDTLDEAEMFDLMEFKPVSVHKNCQCVIDNGEWILGDSESGPCDICISMKREYDSNK